MAQFPAFPLWTDAYLADTGHLTTIEHGAYLLLLMTMWRAGGSLPNDDKQLARYVRMTAAQWARIKPTMMPFFRVSSDQITQGRLTDELVAVRRNSERQSNSARSKWRKEKNKRHASAYAGSGVRDMPNGCQSDAPISISSKEEDKSSSVLSETGSDDGAGKRVRTSYPEAFETFWAAYPKTPNMAKKEAFDAWKRLTDEEREQCIRAIPGYVAYLKTKPDLETIHACRFISKRRFEGYAPATGEPLAAVDDEKWLKRLRYGRAQGKWSTASWGPRPGEPGSLVPPALLESGDGAGWQEMEVAA
ncbi:YdaU family protein [Shinella sp.]|uniref:YdaU family protein n=1 Tax=Shinella sp. TaxID=1870904 RepID=UPI0028AB28D9|nr:DUF1376 domain-containing protein [Shinella sp.]